MKNTEILVYLIPVYAIVIIVLGHLSIKAKEGYGLWLQVSMGLGYLIWAGIIFFIVLLISRGIDLSGIR
ncbi:MAG: hypothetical protein OEZ39_02000 [Gammaproteobacteria bacterium]|nr:hypothetical protein [Gammaproteobacteria bacterium]MDH5650627.1 hypothetical protein [Gammaproteobacteria bacterium]